MKVLVIGTQKRYERFYPDMEFVKNTEKIFVPLGSSDEEILKLAADAEGIAVDAMGAVSRNVIEHMPNLKLIHSEGVGYNGIDVEAAKERGVYVCNCKGINDVAVAEQTIMLMLGCLRTIVVGHQAVLDARQIQRKEKLMIEGITELSECKVGLVGFGDIAKATAKRLIPFECEVYYCARGRKSKEIEEEYHVTYMELADMAKECDIISIHCPVTPETVDLIDADYMKAMKPTAYLINTARGQMINAKDLAEALEKGEIAGAGLDTLYPEPVQKDHPLINMSEEATEKIVFAPHTGGITTKTFVKAHRTLWEAMEAVSKGEEPKNLVW